MKSAEMIKSIQRWLTIYGINVSYEEAKHIDIIEKNLSMIKYRDNFQNKIVTFDILSKLRNKNDDILAKIKINNLNEDFIIEEFYHLTDSKTYNDRTIEAIEAIKSKDKNKLFYSRCYADVKTKYGNFCLLIEEQYMDGKSNPFRAISLYNKLSQEIINDDEFDFTKAGILRILSSSSSHFKEYQFGYNISELKNPIKHIWCYNEAKYRNKIVKSPLYSINYYINDGYRGLIILNGKLKINENRNLIPDFIKTLSLKEYEALSLDAKIYLGNAKENIVILKKDYTIKLIYRQINIETYKLEEKKSLILKSLTNGSFTKDDFEKIIMSLEIMAIDSSKLNNAIIDELLSYIHIHDGKNFAKTKSFISDLSYENLLKIMKNYNLTDFIENLIENISLIFNIPIEEILGKNLTKNKQLKKF